jgi:hypothetical protein
MTKFTRKSKIELEQLGNDEEIIAVTITIDSNHVNGNLDNLMMQLTNTVTSLNNYQVQDKEKKKPKKPKKKQFGGNYV